MADVRFLCVYQDVDRAEQLAETFEASGLSVASGDEAADVTILLWSESAAQSRPFLRAASAACPDTTLIASLTPGVIHPNVFDLSAWDSSKERALVRAVQKITSHADAETSVLPLAPVPMAEPVTTRAPRQPVTSGWRDVDPQPPYRRIGAALALGLIAFLGIQLRPAPTPQAMSVAEAPIVIAEATAYEPATASSIDAIAFEPQADPIAPPQGLLEPASAGDRTPPPYRSWDHEAPAESAPLEIASLASSGFEARFKSATFSTTGDIEAESGWQTASFRLP